MRVSMSFDVAAPGLEAIRFARLLLDLQHLQVMIAGLVSSEYAQPYSPAFDEFAYKYVIELPADYFGPVTATVSGIRQGSPLSIDLLLKIPKAMAGPFKAVYERIFYGDLERERRMLDLDYRREEVRGHRIRNLETMVGLADKIKDPALRERFLLNLESSLIPFLTEHPPIRSIEISQDEED